MASDNDIKQDGDEPQERDVTNPVIDLRENKEAAPEPEGSGKLTPEQLREVLSSEVASQLEATKAAVGAIDDHIQRHLNEMTHLLAACAERNEQVKRDMKRVRELRGIVAGLRAARQAVEPNNG